jgi:hypothetical protein
MKRGHKNKTNLILVFFIIIFIGLALIIINSGFTGNAVKAVKSIVQGTASVKSVTQPVTQPTCIPAIEICDKKDNNCNGQIDEEGVCKYTVSPKVMSSSEKYNTFLASSNPPGITDFYGEVKIDSVAAPAGTIVSAITSGNYSCGTFIVTTANPGVGWYGFLHCSCGGDAPTCDGDKISFAILRNGKTEYQPALIVGDTTWDQSIKRVDLNIITQCSDGISFNTCASSKPKYCQQQTANSGISVMDCQVCGCPSAIKNPLYPGVGQSKLLNYVCCTSTNSAKGYCFTQDKVTYNTGGLAVCPEIRGSDTGALTA